MNQIKFLVQVIILILFSKNLSAQTIVWTKKANPLLNSINGVAFNSDGQKIVTGTNCHPASIRFFDATSGAIDWDYTVGSGFMCIMGVTFSTNSNYIAAIEEFGNIFIFDNTVDTPSLINTINIGTTYGFSTAISPDNSSVAVGCSNGRLKIYTISSGILAYDIPGHPSWVTCVNYSPNGNFIVTGGNDNKVKIWQNTGVLLYTCNGHTDDITNVKVSSDNHYIISSSKDNQIKIWDASTGSLVRTIIGHTDDVNGIAISTDGSKIVSVSSDSSCKIWDFNNGNLLSTFGVPDSGAVNAVAWSPNANYIVTGNVLSDVVLWDVSNALSAKSMSAIEDMNIVLYPNPVSNELKLQLSNNYKIIKTEIYNSTGIQIYSSNLFLESINVEHLPKGIYTLKIYTSENKSSHHSFTKK